MAFEPKKITKEHILQGVAKIQEEQPELNPSTRWDVVINGVNYPPKEIMRYAHQEMNGERIWEYGGGEATNKWLKQFDFKIIDKSDKADPVLELIERYKEHARNSQLKDELYKWRLVKTFKGRPNTNASDFTQELTSINFGNLIYPVGISVIHHIVKERPEEFREAFKHLFDETIELPERISYFNEQTLKIYRDIDPTNTYSHHQDERTMATYLAFHDSSKYAFYKDSFYQKYCKLIGLKPEKKGKKLVHYLTLLDEFIENYILEDSELLDLKKELLTDDCYEDDNHKIYAQDILYSTLDQQKGMGRNYWRVGTSDDQTNYWDIMQANQYISIGWSEIGDLSEQEVQNKKDVIQLLNNQGYYSDDKKVGSRKAGEIFNFYNDIQEGDIILAQDGSEILGIGEVIGDYGYDSSQAFSHYKPVQWKLISPSLKNSEGLRTTVYKLSQPDVIHQIDNLLKEYKKEQKMGNELNQILFGPPGTGKTYNTINQALELCGEDINGLSRLEVKELYKQKVDEGRIVFTTFHQSMTYEDFIEGIKPVVPEKEGDPVTYDIEDGIFKRICSKAQTPLFNSFDKAYNSLKKQLSAEDSFKSLYTPTGKEFSVSLNRNGNLNLHTGKEKNKQGVLTRENLLKEINGEIKFSGWEGYFQGILTVLEKEFNYNRESTSSSENLNYVLIIDEINRGNVSQIFGELITLIEEDKRLGNPEAIQVQLPYSKDWFGVPPNVHIIGTMNTADRSVEALDTALRRRFSFTEMPPKPELINTEGKAENGIVNGIELSVLLETINKRIEKLLDKDHMIGHSYFLSIEGLKGLKSAFQNKIVPLLQEYFFGDYGKIGLVIGSKFFDIKNNQVDENFFAPFEDYDSSPLAERKVYHLKNIQDMSDELFIEALNELQRKNR